MSKLPFVLAWGRDGPRNWRTGVSATTISLFLAGKRKLRPALAVRLVEGLERAFVRKGSRLDTALFIESPDDRTDA